MKKIVFDIETVGEDFEKIDKTTQKVLTDWVERTAKTKEEKDKGIKDIKEGLGFSPLTGEIVSVAALENNSQTGAVYFQAPGKNLKETEKNGIKYRPCTEKEILENFWKVAEHADEFITFNGKGFDVPFIMIRSAIHEIKPSKDLMSNRYLSMQKTGAKHVDLMDHLTFYGAVFRRPNLHLACRAFGIKSPKEDGVDGNEVAGLFKNKEYKKIAEYNMQDVYSTAELYNYWDKYMRM
ncbi:MAG: ribonuclease H-like domain-containing protein [Candidatus Moranbacteria bacterium]|nr:ribonuclease H-like domain-containing protein [Candidatus Moranbacteria bacterium]